VHGSGDRSTKITDVIGVAKAYATRVGNGPFPSELDGELAEKLREEGNEYGATTGRPRRCGWFDVVAIRHAVRVNGLTQLVITKLDVLDTMPEIKIVVEYEIGHRRVSEMPESLADLNAARPICEAFSGWNAPTRTARQWTICRVRRGAIWTASRSWRACRSVSFRSVPAATKTCAAT